MAYHAKVLAHSVGPDSQELFTVEARFPRKVLAEVVTHRKCRDAFGEFELTSSDRAATEDVSKNSASSRAIPVKRMIEAVMTDPYVPEKFSRAGPGMQAAGYLDGAAEHNEAVGAWLMARNAAVRHAQELLDIGVHKQDANRLLEPFAWITQVLTADRVGWNNFFALRCDAAAEPAFQRIARMIYLLYRRSKPESLGYGQWHLPFVPRAERALFSWFPPGRVPAESIPDPIQFSAARCAWVSYENHDRDGTPQQMKRTFARLVAATPKHASPLEAQGTPWPAASHMPDWAVSNLRGWLQARKLIEGERTEVYAPSDAEVASWGLPEPAEEVP